MGRSETWPTFNQGWLTPQLPQRRDSLEDQLRDLRAMANKMGCYDAADWIDPRHDRDPRLLLLKETP